MKINSQTLISLLLILIFISACNKKEILDDQRDYALIKAIESAQNKNRKGIDVEALEKHALAYKKNKEKGKYCLANALIGYKLFFNHDFDKSMIHLKKAEANLEECDSIASFVYGLIANNLSTTDTLLALEYRNKSIAKDLQYNNLKRLPYSYLDKSLLLKGDSAKFYLQKSLELFDDWGDKIARCQYAKWHTDEMELDSIIKYIKPYHDSINFIGHTAILAETYIKKGSIDSAQIYVDQLSRYKGTNVVFYYNKSQLLALKGKYNEAYKWMEKAYNYNDEEWKFITNQRLGAINAEYDLLNAELQNEKKRVRTMRMYNIGLMVLVALLGVAIILIKRYKRDINELEIDIAKRKERFNTLFEKHKSDYVLDKNSAMTEAMRNLEKLHEAYPSLTRTEITIIWLVFMKCTSERICELLSITQNYYYQRKSDIYRTLGKSGKEACDETLEKIVKEYISV